MSDLPTLPQRPDDGHKGTFGTVCVVGGQAAAAGETSSLGGRVMIGGPALCALGALRAGAGLAVLAVPRPIMAASLIIAPSATGLALPVDSAKRLRPSEVASMLDDHMREFSCLAVGPGLGVDAPQQQVVMRLASLQERPMVFDADALNCMAAVRDFQHDLRASAVLTPHPGEYRRLAATLGIKRDPTDTNQREDAAAELAQRLGCVIVLKGHHTVVSDGINTVLSSTGNVALATAGTGDVLTGMIAALIAQHHPQVSLFDCARLAVHAHGLAADQWASRHGTAGMLAMDLLSEVPGAMHAMRTA